MSAGFVSILNTTMPLFVVVGIGVLIRALRLLERPGLSPRQVSGVLNWVVLNITAPALVFNALLQVRTMGLPELTIPLVAWVIIAICGGTAYAVARFLKMRPQTMGAFILVSMAGSTAFFGYPIARELARLDEARFGAMPGLTALYSEVGTLVPMLTIGVLIAARFGEGGRAFSWRDSARSILQFAPFIWLVIALLFWDEAQRGLIPEVVRNTIDILARGTTFLMMFSLGLTVAVPNFNFYARSLLAVNAIKMLLAPILALVFAALLGMDGAALAVVVVNAAVPSVLLAIPYATQYKLDVEFTASAVFSTFFVSLLTLPLFVALAT